MKCRLAPVGGLIVLQGFVRAGDDFGKHCCRCWWSSAFRFLRMYKVSFVFVYLWKYVTVFFLGRWDGGYPFCPLSLLGVVCRAQQ